MCVSTPRIYPQSEYFLVLHNFNRFHPEKLGHRNWKPRRYTIISTVYVKFFEHSIIHSTISTRMKNSINERRRGPNQEALNTWRWRLQHFLQLLSHWNFQKMVVIWFVISKRATNFLTFKGVAQNLCLPRPFEVQNSFGGKSILSQARDTKFGGKLTIHEYINWWKFGVDISNWFEISIPNFHQLLYPWVFNFPSNLVSLAWLRMDFPPKIF